MYMERSQAGCLHFMIEK
uniref:Uncharacterized protein n=1 Tax=Arundo donax TaxID=35708 RepID=A0A0A8ZXX2_ARUDO